MANTPQDTLNIADLNILKQTVLVTPAMLKEAVPMSKTSAKTVQTGRKAIRDIIERKDPRLFLVVGPCSIHDTKAAMEYAEKLQTLASTVSDTLLLVMRVYFEKPRTTVGWKGLINDPYINDSFKIEDGLRIGRQLLQDISELGLPTATEALDPISPQYIQDFICWSAIGARTTESQTHREMASGLSCAVGFKNGTDGGLDVATNALQSVQNPHRFLGINADGQVAVTHTSGNQYGHIVLRGGSHGPNYDAASIKQTEDALAKAAVAANIMVDCSHANSSKNEALQAMVLDNVSDQIVAGNNSIIGAMLESNLHAGNQKIPADLNDLKYGVSVTDACIDWETTETIILAMRDKLKGTLSSSR